MKQLAVLLFVSAAAAQQLPVLEGEISPAAGVDRSRLSVYFQGPVPQSTLVRADVDSVGGFRLNSVPTGLYIVKVVGPYGNELLSQSMQVNSTGGPITLALPDSKSERPPSGSVSVARLRHQPNKPAYKAFLRAQKYSQARDFSRAALELEKAVAADPFYSEAYANLGAQYIRCARWNDAATHLRRAIQLDPATAMYYSNLALALANLQQLPEAEEFAWRSVELDATNCQSQLVLGWILADQPNSRLSAIPYLKYASREIPQAHRILADVYRMAGRNALAEEQMQQFAAASPQSLPKATELAANNAPPSR